MKSSLIRSGSVGRGNHADAGTVLVAEDARRPPLQRRRSNPAVLLHVVDADDVVR